MKIKKTDAEAEAFAANLADEGDAGVFRNLWARGEHVMIRGHFPDFMGGKEEAPASTDTTATEEAPASAVTGNESTDETQAAASGNDAAAAE